MKEYLINSGEFNMIVRPSSKECYILENDAVSAAIVNEFVQGEDVQYGELIPFWFQYKENETWQDFQKKKYQLGVDLSESELIDKFVLKKFNFGSLVAVRDVKTKEVKVFKRDKLNQC